MHGFHGLRSAFLSRLKRGPTTNRCNDRQLLDFLGKEISAICTMNISGNIKKVRKKVGWNYREIINQYLLNKW